MIGTPFTEPSQYLAAIHHPFAEPFIEPSQRPPSQMIGTTPFIEPSQRPASQMIGTPFIEPSQYLAAIPAIPVRSVIASSSFPATVISSVQSPSEYLHAPVVLTSAPNQIQDHLQRKHEELQKIIVQQQEELRRVSEQLFMARYGSIVPLTFGSGMNTGNDGEPSTTSMHHNYHEVPIHLQSQSNSSISHPQIHQQSHPPTHNNQPYMSHIMATPSEHSMNQQLEASQSGDEMISYMQLSSQSNPTHQNIQHVPHSSQSQAHQTRDKVPPQRSNPHPPNSNSDSQSQHQNSNSQGPQQQQISSNSDIELMPFQMTEEQAQILFTSNSKGNQ